MAKIVPRYVPGDYWMQCERTGFRYRRSDMVKEAKTGLWVGRDVVDEPHPREYPQPVPGDRQVVDPCRPEAEPSIIRDTNAWTPDSY